jgi:hypothetical protein
MSAIDSLGFNYKIVAMLEEPLYKLKAEKEREIRETKRQIKQCESFSILIKDYELMQSIKDYETKLAAHNLELEVINNWINKINS